MHAVLMKNGSAHNAQSLFSPSLAFLRNTTPAPPWGVPAPDHQRTRLCAHACLCVRLACLRMGPRWVDWDVYNACLSIRVCCAVPENVPVCELSVPFPRVGIFPVWFFKRLLHRSLQPTRVHLWLSLKEERYTIPNDYVSEKADLLKEILKRRLLDLLNFQQLGTYWAWKV